jgi:hypothetical protein
MFTSAMNCKHTKERKREQALYIAKASYDFSFVQDSEDVTKSFRHNP